MKKLIRENIHDFYDTIGKSLNNGFLKTPKISWLNSGSGFWPNMIYNTHFEENEIDDFVTENTLAIKAKKAPPFWLVYDDELNNKLSQQLKNKGMREIFHWTGMGLKIDSPIENKINKSFIIKTVQNKVELSDWLKIVNTALMTSNSIPKNIFLSLYYKSNFNLYLVFVDNIPISTGLAFFSNNHCGIYMISTLNEYRNKGLGTAVTKQCINDAFKKGINNVVLHASPAGESIYKKMGFKKYCEFSIYWMLGKEFK